MSSKKPDISLIITIGTILLSVGMSYGVLQLRAAEVEKVAAKADATELKVATLDQKLDDIKETTNEIKAALLKSIQEKHR